jgi:hypothetical protein
MIGVNEHLGFSLGNPGLPRGEPVGLEIHLSPLADWHDAPSFFESGYGFHLASTSGLSSEKLWLEEMCPADPLEWQFDTREGLQLDSFDADSFPMSEWETAGAVETTFATPSAVQPESLPLGERPTLRVGVNVSGNQL